MFRSTCFCFGLFILTAPVYAQAICDDAPDQTSMNKCINDQLTKADAQLNTYFKAIEQRLVDDEEVKRLLITAQRAWLKFRDAECSFSTSATTGGTIQPMLFAACKTALTTDRNKQLESYLNCPEGDLTCPVPSAE